MSYEPHQKVHVQVLAVGVGETLRIASREKKQQFNSGELHP